jgi:hypothetical protein
MAKTQVRITDPKETPERNTTAGEGFRQQLLAGLPVAERRLQLNGISTVSEVKVFESASVVVMCVLSKKVL